jgi:apolipoprotein N-acyltransferase
LSGAALLAAAPPAGLPCLVFVALTPLLLAVRRAGVAWWYAAALGWLTGAIFYAGLVPWLVPTVARLQSVSTAASLGVFAVFVAYHAGQFGLAALAMRAAARSGGGVPRAAIRVAAVWVLLEWMFPQVLPWSLGAGLGPHRLLRQAADLIGVHGLAAVIVVINGLLIGRGGARGAALLLVVLLCGYGYARPAAQDAHDRRLRVGIAQAGSIDPGGDPDLTTAANWTIYKECSRRLSRRVDVLLWPESVVRADLTAGGGYRHAVEELAAALRRPLLLGGLGQGGAGGETNAVYAFAPVLRATYTKRALLPFGEYAPGAEWLGVLRAWRTTGRFIPGAAAGPLPLASGAVAVAICFEAMRADAFLAQVRAGAEWLLNPSNDGWFDSPRAAAQHLEMTRLRAVEVRRWLVRVSHSGVSAVFDPDGDIVAALPYAAAGELVARIGVRHQLTPYARSGDGPLQLMATGVLLAWAGNHIGRRFRRPMR